MSSLTILALAAGLAMDAFAVAIAVGAVLPQITFRHYFRLSFHFALFQFLMPIIGWFLGNRVSAELIAYDHWIAFGLLFVIGIKMIYETATHRDEETAREQVGPQIKDPTRKWSLMSLSIATSIDAFAVGLSIALLEIEIIYPSMIIGIVALLVTLLGMRFGARLGRLVGKAAGYCGGIVLIAIGLKILLQNLLT